MDIQVILTAISTVGFPIVACGGLFWLVNKISDQHNQEVEKMTEALNNNTIAITKLTERMNKDYE